MGTHTDLHHDGSVIRYDSTILNPMEPRLFDAAWLQEAGHHRGMSAGRGMAHFVSYQGLDMVLRPFRRGGLVGKLNHDLYLNTGVERSRAMREFALLQWMRCEALPVPRAVAARVTGAGMFYRAAILTERIPDAHPFEDVLRQGEATAALWTSVGATIKQMHRAGVDHTDLNCRNILIDAGDSVWLIDFDKCQRREPGPRAARNLDRLKRSLVKEGVWEAQGWSHLMTGYADV